MIVIITSLSKFANLSCCVVNLNDFIKGTSEIDLATRKGRHKKAPLVKVGEMIFLKEDKVLK